MPRLYGPGHFTKDPYWQVVSPHGIPVGDLVAVLQKEIRRSRIDNAVLAAYEMFTTSVDVAQLLWRRLRLIAVEDVGMGLPLGPVLIDVLHRNFDATPGGEWMMACHAVSRRSAGRSPGLRALRAHPRRSGAGARSDAVVGQRRSSARRTALGGSPVPRGTDRDPLPRRSGERDGASSVALGKLARGITTRAVRPSAVPRQSCARSTKRL